MIVLIKVINIFIVSNATNDCLVHTHAIVIVARRTCDLHTLLMRSTYWAPVIYNINLFENISCCSQKETDPQSIDSEVL